MSKRSITYYLLGVGLLLILAIGWYAHAFTIQKADAAQTFDGERALRDVQTQVAFGPRIPGSEAHSKILEWMQTELTAAGWQTRIQESTSMGHPIQNLVAYRTEGAPALIVGAHYDTRLYADRDPDPTKWTQPVPGADDGASGVAVLLELARTLPENAGPIWLVFFDAEDNGDIPGWDWLLGSRELVKSLKDKPGAMVLLDMVGDADLNLPMEGESDETLRASIWQTAAELGHQDVFIPSPKYNVLDDHTPFLEAGIPAVDIIDLDYPYWHTLSDTPDKVSAKSLQIVGEVLQAWIAQQNYQSK